MGIEGRVGYVCCSSGLCLSVPLSLFLCLSVSMPAPASASISASVFRRLLVAVPLSASVSVSAFLSAPCPCPCVVACASVESFLLSCAEAVEVAPCTARRLPGGRIQLCTVLRGGVWGFSCVCSVACLPFSFHAGSL